MGVRRTKLNTLITFPIQSLDMSQHATKRSHSNHHNTGWSPWRLNKQTETSINDYMYDLYAVCNHYGNMQGGHYTGRLTPLHLIVDSSNYAEVLSIKSFSNAIMQYNHSQK